MNTKIVLIRGIDMDYILAFWALPALVMLLLLFAVVRDDGDLISELDGTSWSIILFMAAIYPIGTIFMLIEYVWPWLIKER